MKYAVILFSSSELNYYCLIETFSMSRDNTFDSVFILGIKKVLNPENELIYFEEIDGITCWRWIGDGNTDLLKRVFVMEENFKEIEFPDDKTALLWFKLNY